MKINNKITIGNVSLSKEGWQWWIDKWEKEAIYSFCYWFKVSTAIKNIKQHIKSAGV